MYQKKKVHSGPWQGSRFGIRANSDITNNSKSIEVRDNVFH